MRGIGTPLSPLTTLPGLVAQDGNYDSLSLWVDATLGQSPRPPPSKRLSPPPPPSLPTPSLSGSSNANTAVTSLARVSGVRVPQNPLRAQLIKYLFRVSYLRNAQIRLYFPQDAFVHL